jgi:hypothetical protein
LKRRRFGNRERAAANLRIEEIASGRFRPVADANLQTSADYQVRNAARLSFRRPRSSIWSGTNITPRPGGNRMKRVPGRYKCFVGIQAARRDAGRKSGVEAGAGRKSEKIIDEFFQGGRRAELNADAAGT